MVVALDRYCVMISGHLSNYKTTGSVIRKVRTYTFSKYNEYGSLCLRKLVCSSVFSATLSSGKVFITIHANFVAICSLAITNCVD